MTTAPMTDQGSSMDSVIWPSSTLRTNGELVVGGVPIHELMEVHGSPLYVLDEADFRSRCRYWLQLAGSDAVHYAAKAFLCPGVATWLAEEGMGLDVCSAGEFAVASTGHFPPGRVFLHGNNKRSADLALMMGAGVGCIVLDSLEEIDRVATVARELRRPQLVMLRVATGGRARTHEHLATAHYNQKFGIPIGDGLAMDAIRRILGNAQLRLEGLHVHVGSQVFDESDFVHAVRSLAAFALDVTQSHGVDLPTLDVGGGYAVPYRENERPIDLPYLIARLREAVARTFGSANVAPHLAFEPGRWIVGPAVVALYRVGTVKRGLEGRIYVSVDGGMSDNPRPSMYGAKYSVALASRSSDKPRRPMAICGEHCEAGDVLIPDAVLPEDIQSGDVLAIPVSGAYQRSQANNYNYVVRPAVISVREGKYKTLIRRESVEDLLRLFPEAAPPSEI